MLFYVCSFVAFIVASAIMKESTYQQCYDTGPFEGWEGKNGMSSWVKMHVPDWILEQPDGEDSKSAWDRD